MNTIADQRRQSLRDLCERSGWGTTELARQIGSGTPSYWSNLLVGRGSFGEKTARKVERALGLQVGALDHAAIAVSKGPVVSPRIMRLAVAIESLKDDALKESIVVLLERLLTDRDSGQPV